MANNDSDPEGKTAWLTGVAKKGFEVIHGEKWPGDEEETEADTPSTQ